MNKTWVAADDAAKNQRHEQSVVELSGNRNEVRDQVDRRGEVREQRRDEDLLAARESLVPKEPGKQHDAVGNETRDRSRILTSAGEGERHERHFTPGLRNGRLCALRDEDLDLVAHASHLRTQVSSKAS